LGDKPTAAFALSLIGGILGLLGGIAFVAFVASWAWLFGTFGLGGIAATIGAYVLVVSLIILLGAIMMWNNPSSAHTWGIVILILSLISANLFGFIGGILAIVWKPSRGGAPPPPS
jgi:hypothetical protein